MRIAYITSHPDMRGGGERFVYETASRLMNLNSDVMLFCNSMDKREAYPEMLEIPHIVLPARRNLYGYFTAYFGLKAIRGLIEEAVRWAPDVIFLQMGYVFAHYFQDLTDIHIVPYVHYPETFQPHKKSWIRTTYRNLLRIRQFETLSFENVPLLMCNSLNTENMIRSLAPHARVKVIYPGLDHDKFRPTWRDEGYVYYHSRFQNTKNQLLAMKAVKGSYPLVLSGYLSRYNTEYYGALEREAAKYGHRLLTNLPDSEIVSLLQNCSLFLFPSRNEHFGIAPIEAMACGKSVIGHDSGGTRETVGKVGILCGDNPRQWSKNISLLMENPTSRADMGKQAYEFSKQFTWDNTVNQILRSFRSLVE